jgi:hypothetical protein
MKLVSEIGRWATKDNSMIFSNVVYLVNEGDIKLYHLLDENMNEVYSVNNNALFINAGEDKIYIGVLSSDNAKLSYLDMDGEELERLKESYEVELVDLNETNIIKEIGKLSYLIIDDYDTSKLSSKFSSRLSSRPLREAPNTSRTIPRKPPHCSPRNTT